MYTRTGQKSKGWYCSIFSFDSEFGEGNAFQLFAAWLVLKYSLRCDWYGTFLLILFSKAQSWKKNLETVVYSLNALV